jgi:excisionase family DNA binding protein
MPPTGKNDPWTSVTKAARALGVANQTVYALITRGELTHMVADGRTFISIKSVNDFIARRDQPAAATA